MKVNFLFDSRSDDAVVHGDGRLADEVEGALAVAAPQDRADVFDLALVGQANQQTLNAIAKEKRDIPFVHSLENHWRQTCPQSQLRTRVERHRKRAIGGHEMSCFEREKMPSNMSRAEGFPKGMTSMETLRERRSICDVWPSLASSLLMSLSSTPISSITCSA